MGEVPGGRVAGRVPRGERWRRWAGVPATGEPLRLPGDAHPPGSRERSPPRRETAGAGGDLLGAGRWGGGREHGVERRRARDRGPARHLRVHGLGGPARRAAPTLRLRPRVGRGARSRRRGPLPEPVRDRHRGGRRGGAPGVPPRTAPRRPREPHLRGGPPTPSGPHRRGPPRGGAGRGPGPAPRRERGPGAVARGERRRGLPCGPRTRDVARGRDLPGGQGRGERHRGGGGGAPAT